MPTTVPRPRGAGHPERPPLPRTPIVTTARMSARLPTLVLVFPSRKAGTEEADVGREVTRAEEGYGSPWASPGDEDAWQILSQECPAVSHGMSACPKACMCWAGLGLGLSSPRLSVWEEKSLCNCPPSPTPSGIEGHPPLHPPAAPHPQGRGPRCTHCKKCTFQGRGCGGGMERPRGLQERGSSGVSIH